MMAALIKTTQHKEAQRFLRFLVVGAGGTMLDFGLLTVLKLAGLPTLPANTAAFSAGVVNNFTWNRLWTYADSRSKQWTVQLGQFAVVSLIGLALNNAVVLLLEAPFGALFNNTEFGYLPAKVIATGIVVFWNFFVNRYWTFNDVS
jgi:putative flippase GtrA